ncbi:hypothetical protein BBP40_006068 [Aspergillus hancockii]|nr:hypothetical protein BBP40_006068 [Aspergillus hancockii]
MPIDTALCHAVESSALDVVKFLLHLSPSINEQVEYGCPLFHYAANSSTTDTLALLLESSAEVDTLDSNKNTPCTMQLSLGSRKIYKTLLAAHCGYPEAVNHPIRAKADVNITSRGGLFPLHVVSLRVDLLQETEFHVAIDWLKTTELLIKAGADISQKSDNKWTPLHHALSCSRTEIAKVLIEKQANLEAFDDQGEMPLHQAGRMGNHEVVKAMLQQSIEVTVRTRSLNPCVALARGHHKTLSVLLAVQDSSASNTV